MDKDNYNGEEFVENAICCHCGKTHYWDEETCEVYRNKFICSECYENHYGYCNECGELNKYTDMNEDIVCIGCSGKVGDND